MKFQKKYEGTDEGEKSTINLNLPLRIPITQSKSLQEKETATYSNNKK